MKPIKQILLTLSVLLAFTLSSLAQEYVPIIRTLPGQPTEYKRVYRDVGVYPKTPTGDKAFLDAIRFNQLDILDRTATPTAPVTISWLSAVRYSYTSSTKELYLEAASEDVKLQFETVSGAPLSGGNKDGAVLSSGTYYYPGPNDNQGNYTKQWKFGQKDGAGGIPAGVSIRLTFQRVSSGATASFTVIPAAGASKVLVYGSSDSSPPVSTTTPAGTVAPVGYGNVYAANSSYQARPNQTVIGSGERNGAYNRVYLEGNGLKIGFNLTLGGTLDYVSLPGQLGGKNQYNSPVYSGNGKVDAGRQRPWSWYTYPNGNEEGPFSSISGRSTRFPGLGWNSVEGGSEGQDPHYGVLRAINVSNNSVYIANSGAQWEIPETAEQTNQKWISFDPNSTGAFREHVRLTMNRTDAQASHFASRRQQEAPAVMTVADFYRVHYCTGQPYQRQWTSTTPGNNGGPLPFWSNEPGIILENPETGACMAFYAPISGRFGYWNATEGSNYSQDYQFQFFYWASFPMLSLDPQGVYDLDVATKNGTLEECRQWLYNQPRWSGTFNYVFNQKSRLAWTQHHGKDQLEANITNGWQVSAITTDNFHDGRDFKIISPEQWIDGRQVKKIYVKGAFTGGASSMSLFYYRIRPGGFAQLDPYVKNFSVINDGAERVYEIDMSGEANWNNQDILSFEIQHAYPYPSPAGALWNIKQISSSPITN